MLVDKCYIYVRLEMNDRMLLNFILLYEIILKYNRNHSKLYYSNPGRPGTYGADRNFLLRPNNL